ncbi:GTA-gp10 family protein [Ruegeria sp. Ofav3-42]|uniref:GTA-gp10 family protein n=1 Tax=Ruegeria sp. Ofav3-42 TaxID=2917759 RepID=UPI001EF67D2E|nr:GTA-gp10 family protein [Ruegeria sp. Ofav3-42]MCG7520848.1 gene transfer agent family protein [Ruegeria sp. Ofav3-42]
MGNKITGRVRVEAESGPVELALTFNAMCELEDAFDADIQTILTKIDAPTPRMKDIRRIVWATMLDANPDATEPMAGELINYIGVDALGEVLQKVIDASSVVGTNSGN